MILHHYFDFSSRTQIPHHPAPEKGCVVQMLLEQTLRQEAIGRGNTSLPKTAIPIKIHVPRRGGS